MGSLSGASTSQLKQPRSVVSLALMCGEGGGGAGGSSWPGCPASGGS